MIRIFHTDRDGVSQSVLVEPPGLSGSIAGAYLQYVNYLFVSGLVMPRP